jgi:SAM dependent carboxyl methyltransferase
VTERAGSITTHVMDAAGFYNRHSAQQEEAATAGVAMLQRAAQAVDIARSGPVVADFGCSQGRNSMHPLSVAIDALQVRLTTATPIVVVHTDLPDNDFSTLFDTVANDADSYRRPGVFTFAAGQSFYDQLLPDATLALGWSATAAVWLRATPCELPDHLFSFAESGARREQWKEAAASGWQTFLRHRSCELHAGGQLVVSLPVAGPGYLDWMHVVEAGARDACDRGILSSAEYASMVLPTYLSEPDDLCDAVEHLDGLVLDEFEIGVAPDPAYSSFRGHHDPARFASEAVDLFRAWAGPSLVGCLDPERDAAARDAAADALFACIRDALAATPTECPWSVGLVRTSRA